MSRYATYINDPFPLVRECTYVIPKRLPPPNLQQIGFLTKESKNQVFPLYGARKYHNDYEYYYSTMEGLKIPVYVSPGKQLYIGDTVVLPGMPGVWTVNLYEPRYQTCSYY